MQAAATFRLLQRIGHKHDMSRCSKTESHAIISTGGAARDRGGVGVKSPAARKEQRGRLIGRASRRKSPLVSRLRSLAGRGLAVGMIANKGPDGTT